MSLTSYEAKDLFQWFTDKKDILVLDVRNAKDFQRFQVESPYPFDMLNVSYYDFMEIEDECVAKVPKGRAVRIVCAQEGSAKYVGEILVKHGFEDVGYLTGGIKTWGNLLVPKPVKESDAYSLYQFTRPGKASCSYGLISGKEMMIFDPSRNIDFYLDFANSKGCKIIKTFETHLQADYISGSRTLAEKTGAEFFGGSDFEGTKAGCTQLVDRDIHRFSEGDTELTVIFTPGHTPGSCCFMVNKEYLISGDMIFIDSLGRPDLGGQAVDWAVLLYNSMLMIKKELADDLLILPAHYMDWREATDDLLFCMDFGAIKERNKSVYNIASEEEFIEYIKANMRQQPAEYALIRLANGNLEQYDEEKEEELDLGKNECAATAYAKAQEEAQA